MQTDRRSSPPNPESQEEHARIVFQLRRLAAVGFLRLPRPEGQREYIRALAELPPDLLELAVSRWIETSTNRFFPFPGELRALVADELHRRAQQLFKSRRELMLADMSARGITVIEAAE